MFESVGEVQLNDRVGYRQTFASMLMLSHAGEQPGPRMPTIGASYEELFMVGWYARPSVRAVGPSHAESCATS